MNIQLDAGGQLGRRERVARRSHYRNTDRAAGQSGPWAAVVMDEAIGARVLAGIEEASLEEVSCGRSARWWT